MRFGPRVFVLLYTNALRGDDAVHSCKSRYNKMPPDKTGQEGRGALIPLELRCRKPSRKRQAHKYTLSLKRSETGPA
jgi:hypothetical protein